MAAGINFKLVNNIMTRERKIIVLMAALIFGAAVDGLLMIAGNVNQPAPANTAAVIPKSTPVPVSTPYQKPELGMLYSEFVKICGLQTRSTWSETVYGKRDVFYYSNTDERYAKGCVGYFVFDEYILTAKYKD